MSLRAASEVVQGVDLRDFILGGVITPSVVVIAWVKGIICRGVDLERERARADKLQAFVTEEMVPALTRATDALQDITPDPPRRRPR